MQGGRSIPANDKGAVAKQSKVKNEIGFPERGCLSHFLL